MSTARVVLRRVVAAFRGEDVRADVLVAAGTYLACLGLVALGLVGSDSPLTGGPVPRWWHSIPLAVGCAGLLIKRRHPLVALCIGLVGFAGDMVIGGGVAPILILWDLLFAVQLHAGPRGRQWVTRGVVVAILANGVVAGESSSSLQAALLGALYAGAVLVTPMHWGANVRQGRELAAVAQERAELERARATDLVRLAEAERHDAVRAERTAMARDLHDVIASHLSAIAITSGAALAGPPDAERDRSALRGVREASLASLAEMRSMIQLLRADKPMQPGTDDRAELAATPRLAGLTALVEWASATGLDVAVDDPDGLVAAVTAGAAQLPAAVDQAAHRIVREALTNALKHGGRDVVVSVRTAAGAGRAHLVIGVRDDGRPDRDAPGAGGGSSPVPRHAPGTGTGLVSMRERAESLGGTFDAGPAGVGWLVRARIPLPEDWTWDGAGRASTRTAEARS